MAVHAAIGKQSHKMQPMFSSSSERLLQDAVTLQFAVGDRLVDARQVLINNSACSKIKVTNFRVAHLSFRQANIHAAGAQLGPWIVAVKLIVKRRRREQRRITVTLALPGSAGIDAPAVANNEHHRSGHTSRTLPMNAPTDKQFFVTAEILENLQPSKTAVREWKMKWRNQLLALGCLLAFGALGVVYFQHWVIRKPFGIILFVGEGLSPARLAPTRTYAGGAGTRLNLDSMPYTALVMNYSKDFAAPDQAAAATAIATGERVTNRAIAVNGDGKPIKSVIELAREYGRATGLVTDAKLTDPTNAAFYAHIGGPNDSEKIAAQFLDL